MIKVINKQGIKLVRAKDMCDGQMGIIVKSNCVMLINDIVLKCYGNVLISLNGSNTWLNASRTDFDIELLSQGTTLEYSHNAIN